MKEAWDQGILEEEDVIVKDSLDDVQLEEDLKILLRPFADGTKVLKPKGRQICDRRGEALFLVPCSILEQADSGFGWDGVQDHHDS